MGRSMPRRLWWVALFLVATPAFSYDRADAVLVVTDDGALDAPSVRAIRNVAVGELRKRGIAISEDRRTDGVRPVDDELAMLVSDLGARRVFALRVGGRLGHKIPLSLAELSPETLAPVYSASLTAGQLEECDVVTERLVDAVLGRSSAESTARMTTVTAAESRPFAKKPGERFWFVGLPVALYNGNGTPAGFSRGGDGVAYAAMEAAWIPFSTEVSPYLGLGVGYMGAGGHGGLGGLVELGVEAFRLHGVRGLIGAQLAVPFFDTQDPSPTALAHRTVYPAGFVRLAF